MTQRTAAYQLLETKLGEDLAEYVAAQRSEGRSWQEIRDGLADRLNVRVSAASLRNWFADAERDAKVGAA